MPLQLSRLTFLAAEGLPGEVSPVTILVGPNNSGKSLALREIASWAEGSDKERKVVDQLDVEWPLDETQVTAMLKPFQTEPAPNEIIQADSFLIAPFKPGGGQNRMWVNRQQLSN